jgi:hypothetical protein
MLVQSFQPEADRSSYEAQSIQGFCGRLLATVRALRYKYTYRQAHERTLWIDMSDSGFPHHQELANMQTDLSVRGEKLAGMLSEKLIKERILDYMLGQAAVPAERLQELALRSYYESLSEDGQFFPFSPGELVLQKKSKGGPRTYTYTWGCYDLATNQPYTHLMSFDQDAEDSPLGDQGENLRQFLEVIRGEGSRVPSMSFLGTQIDKQLPTVHPKILKRTGIGPLYSPFLLKDREPASEQEANLNMVLAKCGMENDFVLLFTEELLLSVRSQMTRSILRPLGTMQEIFHVSAPTDSRAFSRRASMVTTSVLMPHLMRQNLNPSDLVALELADANIFTYDEGGTVHGS